MLILATEETGEVVNPVIPEINEIFWAAVFFFALWALMKYVLLPPIMKAMEARDDKIRGDLDAADRATAGLGQARRDYDEALGVARSEANAIIEAARAEADAHRQSLQASADADVAELRRIAQAEIEASRAAAHESLKGDVASLAVSAAAVVLGKDFSVPANQSVIDAALAE